MFWRCWKGSWDGRLRDVAGNVTRTRASLPSGKSFEGLWADIGFCSKMGPTGEFWVKQRHDLTWVLKGSLWLPWGTSAEEGNSTGWCISFLGWPNKLLLREGRPLPRPEYRLLSNTQKWIVLTKQETLLRKGPQWEQQGKGTQESCWAAWLRASGFMATELVSGLSLTNIFDSGSFLVVHAMLNPDGFQWEWFWVVGRTRGVSSLLLTFPELFWLGLAC